MPFDNARLLRPRIAVIGGGVSGLSAAWGLSRFSDVTLYESEPRFGGHARTVTAGLRGDQPVDTGFIVFNYATYPLLTRLFADLDVPVQKSDMSFGVTVENGRLEYALTSLRALFAQKRNAANPRFWSMLRDIGRFNARAEALATSDDLSISELMSQLRLGSWFGRYYLQPLCGAIWSTPAERIGVFPARTLIRFLRNHALMGVYGQHQWWTVTGGSVSYVNRLVRALEGRRVTLRAGTPVGAVQREAGRVRIKAAGGPEEVFDHVVFATHPDQALRMITAPTEQEQRCLSAIQFQDNHAYLHRDPRQMPVRRNCWSSWVYQKDHGHKDSAIGVTYWMNRLQNIPENDPLFLTLNPAKSIAEEAIYDQTVFRHPVFDRDALRAQQEIAALQGNRNTWFTGAWTRHGFHEDGIASAASVTDMLAEMHSRGIEAAA